MISKSDDRIIRECDFFKQQHIEITPIYLDDPVHKCFLVKSDRNYKVRISKRQYSQTVQSEFDAINLLRQHVKWAPTVYYHELNDFRRRILVYEFVDGISLDKIELQKEAFDINLQSIRGQLRQILTEIHTVTGNYFGEFSNQTFTNWSEYLNVKFGNHLQKSFDLKVLDLADIKRIEAILYWYTNYFEQVKPTLLHFDVKPANIVLSTDGRVTLIDFELCRFGDVMMEYAKMTTTFGTASFMREKILNHIAIDWFNQSKRQHGRFDEITTLYQLYHLLAYYTTSILKHKTPRPKLIPIIRRQLMKIKGSESSFDHQ